MYNAIDNAVLRFIQKIGFSSLNPEGIQRSFDINPAYVTSK